jgi:hypothetical protein
MPGEAKADFHGKDFNCRNYNNGENSRIMAKKD